MRCALTFAVMATAALSLATCSKDGGGGGGTGGAGTGGAGRGGSGGRGGAPGTGGATGGSGGAAGSTGGSAGGTGGGTGGSAGTPGTGGAGGSGGSGGSPAGGTGGPPPDGAGPADVPMTGAKPLRIYWIDVEGGGATLLVAPTGESLLFDAGWSGARDTGRIVGVLDSEVGGKKLDTFVASHYHVDHVGGIGDLARAVTIANFVDHGASVEGGDTGYRAAIGNGKRTSMMAGQKLMLGAVEITVVTSAGRVIDAPAGAAANPLCQGAQEKSDQQDEDPQSLGFIARYGTFELVALGDLTWGVEHRLACPMNRLGQAEIFQGSQHGSIESNPPQLVHALAPQAIVVNNGASKGGAAMALQVFKAAPGMKHVWQVHRSMAAGTANTEDEFIANPGGADQAHWLRATVEADGKFTITNGRTMMSRSYQSR
jgi:competence protein ComEC